MSKGGYIYILASKKYGVLYIGVTNNLIRRVYEHKDGLIEGFTKKYFIKKLVITNSIQISNQLLLEKKS